MLIEMHCHTSEHSPCSHVSALKLVRQVYGSGLQGVVITDHHYLWPDRELKALRHASGVPDYFALLSGQETDVPDVGDVLVYGADRTIPRGTSLASIRADHPDAAIVLAHPYRDGKSPPRERLTNPLVDGVEIFNSNHSVSDNARGLRDWHRYRFTAIAGTDTHAVSYAGTYPTRLDHPVHTIKELAGELKKGRCAPFLIEVPKAKAHARLNEVAFGMEAGRKDGKKIVIKEFLDAERWRSGERAFHIMGVLARHGFGGGRYRVPKAIADDREHMTLIEQGLRGNSLFEKVTGCDREHGRTFVRLSARWLARLHNLGLRITPREEFFAREEEHLARYAAHVAEARHPHAHRALEIIDAVGTAEKELFADRPEKLVQGHGDYHPKNIFIGLDSPGDPESFYVGAIDFDNSSCLPPAFDVGFFLVQFRNQLFDHQEVLKEIPERIFLDAYLSAAHEPDPDFLTQVELFRARASLSIASFLIKVGLGRSENFWRVLVEAERALTLFGARRVRLAV